MSTELIVLKDRNRPNDTLTLTRGGSGPAFVLEHGDIGPERHYWRFLVNPDDLWNLAAQLERLARAYDAMEDADARA